ncbi:MAG: inositol monophosphatase [Parcubacteria group bacterium]|nr:inositol monophosphatase [Parcubacteria group bacterium]
MDKQINQKIKKVLHSAAQEASDAILKYFYSKKFKTGIKSDGTVVTDADKAAEKIIFKHVKKNFPDHAILSEESGANHKKSEWRWVIDPLDGTTNFSKQIPLFCVSIGVLYKDEIRFGIVGNPINKEVYYAEKGKGAFLNGARIHASNTSATHDAYLSIDGKRVPEYTKRRIAIYDAVRPKVDELKKFGAAALELAMVAAGKIDGVIIIGCKPWDVAAGILLVEEAGGVINELERGHIDWNDFSVQLIASNKPLAKKLKKLVK